MKTIIGIDPGASGAISFTNIQAQNEIHVYKCHPNISGRSLTVDLAKNAFAGKNEVVAYIEKVHAMPHDGRSSLFKFGVNYGVWLGILDSKQIPTVEVSPQKWMNFWKEYHGIGLPKEKKERKNVLKDFASAYLDKDKKATLWNADSILITMYGLHQEKGKMNVS